MTEDDKQFFKSFLTGGATAGIIFGSICLVLSYIIWASGTNTPSVNESKVVGKYKECDIIQWHYGTLAEYKYFLYCPKYQESE